MPDLYFSYATIHTNAKGKDWYQQIGDLLTGTKENYHQAIAMLYDDQTPDPNSGIWNIQNLGTKWMNIGWDDGDLMCESAWDVPWKFFTRLYHKLWQFHPYSRITLSFMGNDNGVAHWTYGRTHIYRISRDEVAEKLGIDQDAPEFEERYAQEERNAFAHFEKEVPWKEWAADEIKDLIRPKILPCHDKESIVIGPWSILPLTPTSKGPSSSDDNEPQIKQRFVVQTKDECDHFQLEFEYRSQKKFQAGDYFDEAYHGPGGGLCLDSHPNVWKLFQELSLPCPGPELPPPPKPKVDVKGGREKTIPKTAPKNLNDFPIESAFNFLELLYQEDLLEIEKPDALQTLAQGAAAIVESNIPDALKAQQLSTWLFDQDDVVELYISDEKLAVRLSLW